MHRLPSKKRVCTLVLCCVLMSPVVYWYMTEPYGAEIFYSTNEGLQADGSRTGDTDKDACAFPDFDPFHPDAMAYYTRHPTTTCHGMPTVTYYNGEVVKVNKTKKMKAFGNKPIKCWYRDVIHMGRYASFQSGPWNGPFTESINADKKPPFVEVKCHDKSDKIVSRMHHYITRKEEREKQKAPKHQKKFKPESMNVILMCMDSVARHLFTRAMPKTRKYLIENLGAVELKKYNKVGENTFPNLLALVAGSYLTDLKNWSKAQSHDSLPFLWKDYKKAGYQTQYMTDRADFKDFVSVPTDSFNSPMADALMVNKPRFDTDCHEDQVEVKMWLDLVLEFARESLYSTGRFFSFSMQSRPTHDHPNQASAKDEFYYNFFKELNDTGLLENTFLAFFGDHGLRTGSYRRTFYGSIEERAAAMVVYVPKWFREKYSGHYRNLQYNAKRLTTNFDIHETVGSLLTLGETGSLPDFDNNNNDNNNNNNNHNNNNKNNKIIQYRPYSSILSQTGKHRGLNLFSKIPKERTCVDADITPHKCMCNGGVAVVEPDIMTEVGRSVVKHLNHILKPKLNLCACLSLKSVTSLSLLSGKVGRSSLYRIIFTTEPSGASFEATVRYSVTLFFFRSLQTLGDVSRLDMYGKQSHCVQGKEGTHNEWEMYCYCRDLMSVRRNTSTTVIPVLVSKGDGGS